MRWNWEGKGAVTPLSFMWRTRGASISSIQSFNFDTLDLQEAIIIIIFDYELVIYENSQYLE